ncbi:MAG: response regulator [Oscillospiraceae bacterium]|nr:response regulator [Oscillospiraceae bacterium]
MSKKYSVLIVDDEPSNIGVLSSMLRSDYKLLAATNGSDAIEAAEKHSPDIILLDVVMPEMDGYAVIEVLKSSAKTKNIPVVFLTAKADPENERRGLELGAEDYIFKPFSKSILLKRLKMHLRLDGLS